MAKIAETQIVQRQCPKIIGKHIYGNMYDVEERYTANIDFLTKLVVDAARIGNMHIIEMITKKFPPYNGIDGGVSVIALIEESHIALHTWPESAYATLDIYSCGESSNPEVAFKYILSKLKPKNYKEFNADRSNV